MSKRNPRYTKDGLEVEHALLVAEFMGWNNAVADAVIRGAIPVDTAVEIVNQASKDIETLMLDGSISMGNQGEAWLGLDNRTFVMALDVIASNVERIAAQMEGEGVESGTGN